MKKRFFALIITLTTMLICTFGLTGCSKNNVYENSVYKNEVNEELQIINMFVNFASYSEGSYTFKKYYSSGNCNFLYSFTYSPTRKMYHCSVLVTTNNYYNMYDYGSITFSWGDFKNALFYGYHELENTAIIELSFSNINLNSNISLDNKYSYQITKNTIVNLNKQEDIDEYASVIFECMNRSVGYAQSVIYSYTDSITLW